MADKPSEKHMTRRTNTNNAPVLILSIVVFILIGLLVLTILGVNYSNTFLIIMLSAAIIFALLQSFLAFRFFKSLGNVIHTATKLSNGDFNVSDIRADHVKGFEVLALAFNEMKSNLLSFIEMTKGNVIVLSDAIDKVSKSIDMSYRGNEQIAANINQVAEKAQDQLRLAKETINGIEGISKRVEVITDNIANIEKCVEDTVHTTQDGNAKMDVFYSQLDTISNNLNSTYDFIEKLNLDIKEITEVSEFIIRVSEQLKLLGINASVEASKAGEFSKGFTVVANEINQLSVKTKEGIVRIRGIVQNIIQGSNMVSESITSCVQNFNSSKETFDSVKESFQTINEQSEVLNNGMKDIYREINEINLSSKETNHKSNSLFVSSNDISAKTQEVAAVTEEELAELEEIRHNTQSLNNMLSGIQNLIGRYNTSVKPIKSSPKKLNIAFISAMDNAFWLSVRRGVLYAQKELSALNAHVEYLGMELFNQPETIKLIEDHAEKGYDGFVIPGFFPDTIPIINNLWQKGVPFMIYNCDLPAKSKRLANYGPNTYNQGSLAGELMLKAINGNGNILIAGRHDEVKGVHGERITGFKQAMKNNKKVEFSYVRIEDTNDIAYNEILKYLKNNRSIDGLFIAGGGSIGAAKAIEELGLKGKTRIVCFDHDQDIFEYIKKGIIHSAIGQDPFGQGHDPIIYLYNYLVTGQKPEKEQIEPRSDIVDIHNVNELINL